ncbi:MAG: hypothetical protein Kow0092_30690 [Deferrisomatales bacterium]
MLNYFKEIFAGLWTLLVGMKLTAKYAASPTITAHYPFETLEITTNFRGHTDLVINAKTGKDKCIVCMMCQRTCPSQCITVEGEKPEGAKKKVLTRYCLDFTKCSLCGNCVEVCPTGALEYSDEYQLAGFSRHDFHYDLVERFRERARALGIEPRIADLSPVPAETPKKAANPGPAAPASGEAPEPRPKKGAKAAPGDALPEN